MKAEGQEASTQTFVSPQRSPVEATLLLPHTVAVGVDLVFCAASAADFVESCEDSERQTETAGPACFDAAWRLTIRCQLLLWEAVKDGSAGSLGVAPWIAVLLQLGLGHQVNLQLAIQAGSCRQADTMSPFTHPRLNSN